MYIQDRATIKYVPIPATARAQIVHDLRDNRITVISTNPELVIVLGETGPYGRVQMSQYWSTWRVTDRCSLYVTARSASRVKDRSVSRVTCHGLVCISCRVTY